MSFLPINYYNRGPNPIYEERDLPEIKFEKDATFEADWNPEDVSSGESERFVDDLHAYVVALKEPRSPAEEHIYSRIITAARIEEYRLEDIARTKRTVEIEWDSFEDEIDPKKKNSI